MTNQEIFDKVTAHLLTQGRASAEEDGRSGLSVCYYRGPDGLKCAIGCLIDDDSYSPELEGLPVWHDEVLIAIGMPDADKNLLSRLQSVHDASMPECWEYTLRGVAADYGLEFNPPREADA